MEGKVEWGKSQLTVAQPTVNSQQSAVSNWILTPTYDFRLSDLGHSDIRYRIDNKNPTLAKSRVGSNFLRDESLTRTDHICDVVSIMLVVVHRHL
jgi:hypothetical protein